MRLFYVLIILFMLLIGIIGSSSAGQGDCDGQFQWAGSLSFDGATDTYSGSGLSGYPNEWYIFDIEDYQNVFWIEFNTINATTKVGIDSGAPAAASTTCTIYEGFTGTGQFIGSGTIGYWKTADKIYCYIEPNSWNISGLSGNHWIYINYTNADLYNLRFLHAVGVAGYSDAPVLMHYGGVGDWRVEGNYVIYNNVNWRNTYEITDTGTTYQLNLTKNSSGVPYNSKIQIIAGSVEYVNETSFNSNNISVLIFPQSRTPIYLYGEDPYGRTYSAQCYDPSSVTFYGTAFNATSGALLQGVSVSYYQSGIWYNDTTDATGYYEVTGLTAEVDSTLYANLSGYTYTPQQIWGNVTTEAGLYNVIIPMMPTSGDYTQACVAGTVTGQPYITPISSATVNIWNATYSTSTTTTSTGFYYFDGLLNDTYTLNASHANYDTSSDESVTLTVNEYEVHDFLLNPNFDLTVYVKDIDTLALILNGTAVVDGVAQSFTTGSTTFTNLDPGSYEVNVEADGYYPAVVEKVVDDFGETTTIYMTATTGIEDTGIGAQYPPHLVEIRLQDTWGRPLEYVLVEVDASNTTMSTWDWLKTWLGMSSTPASQVQNETMNGTTDYNGAVTFMMIETVEYTITCTNTTQGISQVIRLYPRGDQYMFTIGESPQFHAEGHNILEVINASVTTNTFNTTHSYINVTFNDSLNQTTNCTIYINQTNQSDYQNQTIISSYYENDANLTHSFLVVTTGGRSYFVHYQITHTLFGTVIRDFAVKFRGIAVDLGWDERIYTLISFSVIIFLGLFFGRTSVEPGGLLCCGVGWIFWGMGWLNSLGTNGTIALTFASVVALAAVFAKFSRREGSL